MKIIENIVLNEFTQYNYEILESSEGVIVLGSKNENVFDYWIITSKKERYDNQLDLYELLVEKLKDNYRHVDKNLSLLLLCNIDNKDWANINPVDIENDKSYFKKYVLKYTSNAAQDLANLIEKQDVKAWSEIKGRTKVGLAFFKQKIKR